MTDLIVDVLKAAVALAIQLGLGRDRVQSLLDAEYAAADAIADTAEKAKLGE